MVDPLFLPFRVVLGPIHRHHQEQQYPLQSQPSKQLQPKWNSSNNNGRLNPSQILISSQQKDNTIHQINEKQKINNKDAIATWRQQGKPNQAEAKKGLYKDKIVGQKKTAAAATPSSASIKLITKSEKEKLKRKVVKNYTPT